jgi:predicted phage baseplate assembly protein
MAEPEILKKDSDSIADELIRKIPAYTPEWVPAGDTDPGVTLVRIYANLVDITIRRLNAAPGRQFLSFLESLNITLHPALPARVPLTFLLARGAPGPVLIPASSLASAPGDDGKPIMFQTEENLLATPAKIIAVFSVTGEKNRMDEIHAHHTLIGGIEPGCLFSGDTFQEHALYLGDQDLFTIAAGASVSLYLSGSNLPLFEKHVKWYYLSEAEELVDGEKKKVIVDTAIRAVKMDDTTITLTLKKDQEIEEIELPDCAPGVRSRWIKAKANPGSIQNIDDISITGIRISVHHASIPPDFSFFNDVSLDLSRGAEIYPFGQYPRLYDTWYIASGEVFSKTGSTVILSFILSSGAPRDTAIKPAIAWEYWDGESWQHLTIAETEETLCVPSESPRTITIPTLPGLKKTRVNGKEDLWIRARLVKGDYGKSFVISGNSVTEGSFYPPGIKNTALSYQAPISSPERVLAMNNLDAAAWPGAGAFRPFMALGDSSPALYLCLDQSLPRGETSIFVAIDESIGYPESYRPKMSWQYLGSEGIWNDAVFVDETMGFTRSGMVKVFIADPMEGALLFGEKTDRFWIRAVNTTDNFVIPGKTGDSTTPDSENPRASYAECRGTFAVMDTSLVKEAYPSTLPSVTGIFLNSVWASQSRVISDEIAGSGKGEQSQTVRLLSTPVTDETVWVDELATLAESERTALEAQKIVDKKTDDKENLLAFWVRWQAVDDLVDSRSSDRHYTIDRTYGVITFGDGKNGRIPPIGTNNIRVSYCTGGGSAGNLDRSRIAKLHSAIAFVDKVTNAYPSLGGTDTESTEALTRRAPMVLKNRGRAVTAGDYEILALESSPEVARAKAIQNARLPGSSEPASAGGYVVETGYVTVVIVPWSTGRKPVPSPALKNTVRTYLQDRCPNVVTLEVIRPAFVSAAVTAEIITGRTDAVPVIEQEAKKTITAFLHPLTGNTDGKGWAFGTVPCISDLYSVLENIADVAYVKSVDIILTGDNDSQVFRITDSSGVISLPGYAMIYPGECQVTARLHEGGGVQ